jgi:adenylate cyclase
MRKLPGPPRCKLCYNPFGGFGGRICRVLGMAPSKKNPQLCSLCCEKLPPGGAEVEVAILFADVRGSTGLADRLGPAAYAAALNGFYRTATEVLVRHDAIIDKLIGDEVMAFFVPGFAGDRFRLTAIEAGRSLLRALERTNARLPVGVGVEAGLGFVGNVGEDRHVDFTVLGDPVNMAAHIQAAARPGELMVGEGAFSAVADRYPGAARRDIPVKGKDQPVPVWSIGIA